MKKLYLAFCVLCLSLSTFAQPTFINETWGVAPNAFSNNNDNWGFYTFSTSGNSNLMDRSTATADNFGIIVPGYTDGNFFAVQDVQNPDNAGGTASVTLNFDISGAGDLTTLNIDMAAMGDFEPADDYTWSYSIDGGGSVVAFDIDVDNSASQTYTLEDGTTNTLNDPLDAVIGNGGGTVRLNNNMTNLTYTFPGSTTGTTLNLTLDVVNNGGAEVYIFDNIDLVGSSGALNLDFSTNSFGNVALPVEFSLFEATLSSDESMVNLYWETSQEVNSDYMAIERKGSQGDFAEIGRTTAAGFSQEAQQYFFVDEQPLSGANVYRIKEVDFDGKITFSPAIELIVAGEGWQLYPSAADEQLTIAAPGILDWSQQLRVFNLSQQEVMAHTMLRGSEKIQLDVQALPAGLYFVEIQVGAQPVMLKFVKN
ncbi:MAG: T9SS type A sorting domain-containing protein [Bacteroidota bacterium]